MAESTLSYLIKLLRPRQLADRTVILPNILANREVIKQKIQKLHLK